MLVIHPKMSSL